MQANVNSSAFSFNHLTATATHECTVRGGALSINSCSPSLDGNSFVSNSLVAEARINLPQAGGGGLSVLTEFTTSVTQIEIANSKFVHNSALHGSMIGT